MEILTYIIAQLKIFLYGFLGGIITESLYIKVGHRKFNFLSFLWSSILFGMITLFTYMYIDDGTQKDKLLSIAVILAFFVNLLLPFFIENKDVRDKFALWVISRWGFEVKGKKKDSLPDIKK